MRTNTRNKPPCSRNDPKSSIFRDATFENQVMQPMTCDPKPPKSKKEERRSGDGHQGIRVVFFVAE